MSAALEIRAGTLALSQGRAGGYAARFNSPSQDLGGFIEVIKPGAFSRSLASGANVRALYDHDRKSLLGSTQAKTLTLREDQDGLSFELDLPATTVGRDVAVLIERGDVAGCSFGFLVNKDVWLQRDGQLTRELIEVDLVEITLTADPAYLDTSVAMRSAEAAKASITTTGLRNGLLWLETCK